MASPFPANATLTFLVPTGEPDINDLGEPVAMVEEWVVQCYLRAQNRTAQPKAVEAGEMPRIYIKGRIVSVSVGGVERIPAALPATVQVGAKATATINDLGGFAAPVTGDFYLEMAIASAFGTSAALGAPIEGYLTQTVNWGEALL